MQTDPIGNGDGMNSYNYVRSDPVNGNDPNGLYTRNVSIDGGDAATIVVSGLFCHACGFSPGPYESVAFLGGLPIDFSFDLADYGVGPNDIVVTAPEKQGPCLIPRVNIMGGLSGTAFGLPGTFEDGKSYNVGTTAQVTGGISVPLDQLIKFIITRQPPTGSQIVGQISGGPLLGAGGFLGGGPGVNLGVSREAARTGWDESSIVQGGFATGGGAEGSLTVDSAAIKSISVSGGPRAGNGAYLSGGKQITGTWALGPGC